MADVGRLARRAGTARGREDARTKSFEESRRARVTRVIRSSDTLHLAVGEYRFEAPRPADMEAIWASLVPSATVET